MVNIMVGSDHFVKSFLTIVKNDLTVWCCLIIVFISLKAVHGDELSHYRTIGNS